jgi:hypothetical protein
MLGNIKYVKKGVSVYFPPLAEQGAFGGLDNVYRTYTDLGGKYALSSESVGGDNGIQIRWEHNFNRKKGSAAFDSINRDCIEEKRSNNLNPRILSINFRDKGIRILTNYYDGRRTVRRIESEQLTASIQRHGRQLTLVQDTGMTFRFVLKKPFDRDTLAAPLDLAIFLPPKQRRITQRLLKDYNVDRKAEIFLKEKDDIRVL